MERDTVVSRNSQVHDQEQTAQDTEVDDVEAFGTIGFKAYCDWAYLDTTRRSNHVND